MSEVNLSKTDGNEEGAGTSTTPGEIRSILSTASTSSDSRDSDPGPVLPSDSPLAPTSAAIQWLLDIMDTAITTYDLRVKLETVKDQLHNLLRTLPVFGRTADDLHHCYALIREKNRKEKALEEEVASLNDKVRQFEENDKGVEFFVEQYSSEHEKRVKAEAELEEVKKQLELLQRSPPAPVNEEEGPALPIFPLASLLEITHGMGVELEGVGEGQGRTSYMIPAEVEQAVGGGDGDPIHFVLVEPPPPNELIIEDPGSEEREEGQVDGNGQLSSDINNPVPPEGAGEPSLSDNDTTANLIASDTDPSVNLAAASDPIPAPPPTRKRGYNLRRKGSYCSKVVISKRKKVIPQMAATGKPTSGRKAGVVPAAKVRAKTISTAKSSPASAGNSTTTPEKTFMCEECGKSFKRAGQLSIHMYIHKPESKPFACTGYGSCEKRFYDRTALNLHIRSHTGDRPFCCSKCVKRFVSNAARKFHERTNHDETRTRDFACDLCPKKCFTKSDLVTHKKIHVTVKAFHCSLCTRTFKTPGEVKRHQVAHSSETFPCRFCPRLFKWRSHLKFHEDCHEGIQNHECEVCQQRFTRNVNLVKHMRTHTGERPYQCRYCRKAFSQKSSLSVHEKHQHPDQGQD